MPRFEAFELYRFYHRGDDETAALRGVSLQLCAGELVALLGPSGSGKSTLLACLAGLEEPDGGHVDVMGQRLSRRPETVRAALRARHIGMLMQSGNLFEHLTVEGNMRLQMSLAGRKDRDKLDTLLGVTGLAGRRRAYPSQLSGGEAARAGLAVALSAEPMVLLADEPTAEVDAATETVILSHLIERCHGNRTMALIATHSDALAARADRVLVIRDGRLVHA
ncbi:ATP-binding cassette domain-containing protein [Paraburkholderia madseniana]|uniref:ATP-binding cassette domain-containing protein n=1 Tax=Paraburkholderia madseniana TaxID=2599607 RepID=A0A6N6W3R3_9BURK|nr:ABC transporter ATP-binding protein [Paraburkholderia madseniana]KAE8754851.1 ATP-binding cassette domain-containing protein [Paraburkholderia madseniana]